MKNVAGLHGQVCTRPQHNNARSSPQAPAVFDSFQIRVGGIRGRWEQKGESLTSHVIRYAS